MTAIERVGLLDSNNTLLNSDYDFSAFELRLTDNTGGVLFDDVDVKTEFDLSGTSGDVTISAGNAIIVATRATSTPIANKKIAVRYQLSDTKTLTGTGTKIYIELDQTLIDDPTLIEDTYPNIDYAQGKNIGELKRADERPTTNPHIKLWEYDGAWNDLRTYPEIDGKKIDSNVVKLTGNQTIAGVKTFTSSPIVPTATQSGQVPNLGQVESAIVEATGATDLVDGTFMLGEPCTKGDSLFKEVGPTFAHARTAQNIGDVAGNTRVSIPVIGSGVAGNSLKLALAKVDDLGKDLTLRIETDNAGEPSGTLVDTNATANIVGLISKDSNSVPTTTNTSSGNYSVGMRISANKDVIIKTVVKNGTNTATRCKIVSLTGNELLATAPFVGDVATFSKGYFLASGQQIRIETDKSGDHYVAYVNLNGSAGFPVNGTNINFLNGSSGGNDGYTGGIISVTCLTNEDITLAGTITLTEGTKAHIVLAQEGDEVDPARYFKVGYSTKNTTTRPLNVFDGTDWGTADNDKFAYTSSDLFANSLLSKTDATYSYKLPKDIPRFAKSDGAIGEKVKCSYLGIADLFSGMTPLTVMYIQDVPGTIGAVAGTNSFVVGKTISDTKLFIKDIISGAI